MLFESPDVLPGRWGVWQLQPEGRGRFTKYCAVADSAAALELHSNPPVKLASNQLCGVFGGREDGRENCTKRGFTAFVGGGGEEEELLDEAASDGSVVGRLTEVSWQGWMAPAPPPAWLASQ